MTLQDYDQKKHECWEEFCKVYPAFSLKTATRVIFKFVFKRAYALGKQEKDADTVIQGWVARDKGGTICLYNEYPERYNAPINEWGSDNPLQYYRIPDELFPDLTWESEPEPVEIIIKRKNN